MKRTAAASLLAVSLLLSAALPARADGPAESRQQIERVIEQFRKAIINKDKDGFMKLFLREDITWMSAYDDTSLDTIMAKRKDKTLPRPKKIFSGSPRGFIESIAKAPGPEHETIDNVHIDTDGDVAQVWFDYTFMIGNYRNNWGKETWQMLRTEEGWKIAAVTWSTRINPEDPPKPADKPAN